MKYFFIILALLVISCEKRSSPLDKTPKAGLEAKDSDLKVLPAKIVKKKMSVGDSYKFENTDFDLKSVAERKESDKFLCLEEVFADENAISVAEAADCFRIPKNQVRSIFATDRTAEIAKYGRFVSYGEQHDSIFVKINSIPTFINLKTGTPTKVDRNWNFDFSTNDDKIFGTMWERKEDGKQVQWGTIIDAIPDEPFEITNKYQETYHQKKDIKLNKKGRYEFKTRDCERGSISSDGTDAVCHLSLPDKFRNKRKVLTENWFISNPKHSRDNEPAHVINLKTKEQSNPTAEFCQPAFYPYNLSKLPRLVFGCTAEKHPYVEPLKSLHVWTPQGTLEVPEGKWRTASFLRLDDFVTIRDESGMFGTRTVLLDLERLVLWDIGNLHPTSSKLLTNQKNQKKGAEQVLSSVDVSGGNPVIRELETLKCPGKIAVSSTDGVKSLTCYEFAGRCESNIHFVTTWDLKNKKRYFGKRAVAAVTEESIVFSDGGLKLSGSKSDPCQVTALWSQKR